MKRSVAVIGATPSFIRWAIEKPCDLRDCDVENLADSTFRQLRAVRELSDGLAERRVVNGICLARDSADKIKSSTHTIGDVMGFPTEEVFDLYGDSDSITALCGQCPANCHARGAAPQWAGCFGWLPTRLAYSFDQTISIAPTNNDDLVHLVNETYAQNAALYPKLPTARAQPFYLFWRKPWVETATLETIVDIFTRLRDEYPAHSELSRFALACQRCLEHSMRMYAELVPSGFSDGIHWRRQAACSLCGFDGEDAEPKTPTCSGCGTDAPRGNERKSKVLGRRPFLQLNKILGPNATEQLIADARELLEQP